VTTGLINGVYTICQVSHVSSLSRDQIIEKLVFFLGAHLLQQCNNFKDPGVQHYGQGQLFNSLRDEMDGIFCGLPAPKSSAVAQSTPNPSTVAQSTPNPSAVAQSTPNPSTVKQSVPQSSVTKKPASNSPSVNRKKSAEPVDMSVFNNANNPCFHGSCTVLLIDGSVKLVKDVRRGDRLFPHGGTVNYVLRTVCIDGQAQMVVVCSVFVFDSEKLNLTLLLYL
jgi:hypothetical protein